MSILIRRRRAIRRLNAPKITHAATLPDPAFRLNTSAHMKLMFKETLNPGGSGCMVEIKERVFILLKNLYTQNMRFRSYQNLNISKQQKLKDNNKCSPQCLLFLLLLFYRCSNLYIKKYITGKIQYFLFWPSLKCLIPSQFSWFKLVLIFLNIEIT